MDTATSSLSEPGATPSAGALAPWLALFEMASVGMVITDPQDHVVAVNPACCRLLGCDRTALEQQPHATLLSPDEHAADQAVRDALLGGSPSDWSGERHYLARDGRIVWALTRVSAVRSPAGDVTHLVRTIEDITGQRELALQQQRQETLLRMAGKVARVGGWLVGVGHDRVQWSDTVCEIHELPPGTSPTVAQALAHYTADSLPRITAHVDACLRDGTPFDDELQIVTARGRCIWVRAIGQAVRDVDGRIVQIQGAFQDITERRDAEWRARDLSERLTRTLESLTDAFIMLDPDWRLTYLNREAEHLLLRERSKVLGRDVWEEFPDATSFEHHYRRAVREQQAVSFEEFYAPLDRWFEVKAYPSAEGLAIYFRDVTERRRAQEQLQRTLAELQRRNRELQDFAFVASHDLQEPLRKIRTFCDRLLTRHEQALPATVVDQLQRIDRAAQRMNSLIDALLGYTRVASRNEPFTLVDLGTVCTGVIDDLEAAIEASAAHIDVGPLPTVPGDALQLRQLFQNLLSNALKFRDPQRPARIRITASAIDDGARWRVVVQDNGIGFDSRHAAKIFSPFQRLHTREEFDGTGIGLAIVQRILERHGGHVEAAGEPGLGARFTLLLPSRQARPDPSAAQAPISAV